MYYTSYAQKVVDVNAASTNGIGQNSFYSAGGVPFVNAKFVNLLEGTPYLSDTWMTGRVVSNTGKEFSGQMIKLDLLNNELHFINNNGSELISNISAKEIWLHDSISGTNYHLIHTSSFTPEIKGQNHWYQLLDSGKVRLYKAYQKVLTESLPYGGSTYEQRIRTIAYYFIEINNTLHYVKKIKELPEQLADKKKELDAFIKKQGYHNNVTQDNWIQVMKYYNGLFQ